MRACSRAGWARRGARERYSLAGRVPRVSRSNGVPPANGLNAPLGPLVSVSIVPAHEALSPMNPDAARHFDKVLVAIWKVHDLQGAADTAA
jgi:hypothetical protein